MQSPNGNGPVFCVTSQPKFLALNIINGQALGVDLFSSASSSHWGIETRVDRCPSMKRTQFRSKLKGTYSFVWYRRHFQEVKKNNDLMKLRQRINCLESVRWEPHLSLYGQINSSLIKRCKCKTKIIQDLGHVLGSFSSDLELGRVFAKIPRRRGALYENINGLTT